MHLQGANASYKSRCMQYDKMRNYLKTFNILTDDEIDLFEKKAIHKKINKNDFFIKEVQVSGKNG